MVIAARICSLFFVSLSLFSQVHGYRLGLRYNVVSVERPGELASWKPQKSAKLGHSAAGRTSISAVLRDEPIKSFVCIDQSDIIIV